MSSTYTLNQNIADCLRSVNHVGGTTVRNICTGAEQYVPWGALDWIGWGFVAVLLLAAIAMFGAMASLMWRDL